MKLQDKQVLLSGATGGIGWAIAERLAEAGAKLLLLGRNETRLKQLQLALPGEHRICVVDLNSASGRAEVLQQCQQEGLDVWVNAAGVLDFQLFDEQDAELVQQMLTTNLVSPILLAQSLLPLLQQRESSVIVNIGSIFGSIGHPGFAAYCASKFGLRGFTEALQRELGDSGVRVLYLAPRATHTDLNSMAVTALNEALGNSVDSPHQVAQELMNLLAGSRKHHYMGWPERLFVRINGLFPGVVHQALVKKLAIIKHHAQS
ncbi:MAG TPA: SDR family oxidoreductase [Xanthomonadales bacterium]|nr:SDR family oxidoreductase [Xanthomonadales bacterium]